MFGENARLLSISQPGASDGYGDTSADGTVVWSGSAPCTLRRRRALDPFTPASSRTSGGGRSDIQTIVEVDELIVRTATGITLGMVPGGRETGWTVLVEDRRDAANVTQHRYTVRSSQLRAGATPGRSISLILGDG
jgi:hypothetical protein